MTPADAALEALLLRVVPGLGAGWQGATAGEAERLEALAGRPLPPLYHWFLSRMGRSMGPMRYPTVDFSASGILSVYASGRVEAHPRFFLIGYEHDELSPLHYFYDLDRPARGDALVVRMLTPRDEQHPQFESLREMLAWGELWTQRVEHATQQCRGTLRAADADLHGRLAPVLRGLGFDAPVETGPFCGLYERADAAFVCSADPDATSGTQSFGIGAGDGGQLARVLSAVANEGHIEVTPSAWVPPLPPTS